MLRIVLPILVLLAAAPVVAAPEMALCPVCRVKEGTTVEEEVKAVRIHEGVRYGFCSAACAKEFDAEPAAYATPSFPRPAPAFDLTDLTGAPLSSEALRGKVVLLDFWATWCAPCRKSMPALQALHDKHRARGFTVVGVSIDRGSADKVKRFLAKHRIRYPVAIDSETSPAWEAYRVKAVPAAFLIDHEGRVVAQWTGIPADERELERTLDQLLPAAD